MNKLDTMAQALLEKSRAKAGEIEAAARQEADELVAAANRRGQEQTQAILLEYEKKAQESESRSRLREKMEKRHMLLAAKQQMVDQVVEKVRQRFVSQSQEQWLALLTDLLCRGARGPGGEVPKILVPAPLVEPVSQALGGAYAVEGGDMSHGFIFSFPQYDLNYEGERLFTHHKERLEREAAGHLFDGDDHEGS